MASRSGFKGTYCKQCKKELWITHGNKGKAFCDMYCRMSFNNPDFRPDFFRTPELTNSYWAGFIAADGAILEPQRGQKVLSIGLKADDRDHLLSLQSQIGAGSFGEYTRFDKRTEKNYHSAQYRLGSDAICEDLATNYNIHPRKSLSHQPPNLKGELAYAFIAGYIDGDGCYYKGKYSTPILTVEGTFDMLSWLVSVCGVEHKGLFEKGKIAHLALYADNALLVYSKYSKLNIPLLDRKTNFWKKSGARTEIRS